MPFGVVATLTSHDDNDDVDDEIQYIFPCAFDAHLTSIISAWLRLALTSHLNDYKLYLIQMHVIEAWTYIVTYEQTTTRST